MSGWTAVLGELAAAGGTVPQIAARLAIPEPLVAAIVAHAARMGLVQVGGACGTSCGTAQTACAGCPVSAAVPGARPRGVAPVTPG
ncbi:MAG: MarR family transcriptional regulator [Thermoleophilia bacterium]|nr:MarR family transcriptional regulator [Thermoleophilia bacterium]